MKKQQGKSSTKQKPEEVGSLEEWLENLKLAESRQWEERLAKSFPVPTAKVLPEN
jgi:hypothetical protein